MGEHVNSLGSVTHELSGLRHQRFRLRPSVDVSWIQRYGYRVPVSRLDWLSLLRDVQLTAAEEWDEYAERVLEAAEAQFSEFGLGRTSMDRVAEAAGVSRITVYRRFANRDALFAAVVARAFRRFLSEFDAEVSKCGDPDERFVRGVAVAARLLTQDSLIARLVRTDPQDVLPFLTVDGAPILVMSRGYVVAQLERAKSEGMPITGNLEMLADVLVRMAHSILLSPGSVIDADEAELARFARQNILPMLYGTT